MPSNKSMIVFYLDDEPDLCENLSDILTSPEVTVETFQDVAALLNRCKITKPDLVFLDYRLPGVTGDDVAQKLDPAIPKVLITGDIQVKTMYPFFTILAKPTHSRDLFAVLEQVKKKIT